MKKVGTGEATAVSDPGTDISITIGIPDEMINKDAAVSREYVIIRLHVDASGSEVDTLHGNFDESKQEFTFVTDRFSTYALTYIDTVKTTEALTTASSGDDDVTDDDTTGASSTGTLVASENKGNTSPSAANAANAANSASADVGASSPKTADTANIPAMAALMAVALLGVKAGYVRRK
jgi:hypothetical protein